MRRDEYKPKNASVSQNLQVKVRKIEDEKLKRNDRDEGDELTESIVRTKQSIAGS